MAEPSLRKTGTAGLPRSVSPNDSSAVIASDACAHTNEMRCVLVDMCDFDAWKEDDRGESGLTGGG